MGNIPACRMISVIDRLHDAKACLSPGQTYAEWCINYVIAELMTASVGDVACETSPIIAVPVCEVEPVQVAA